MPTSFFRSVLGVLAVSCLTACGTAGYTNPPVPPPPAMLVGEVPRAHVSVREERQEIEIVTGPFHLSAVVASGDEHGGHHGHESMNTPMVVFPWPVDGGMTGFRMSAYLSDGTPLPRTIIHHVIGVNLARRQLVYPAAERLFGFGTETPDIKLPGFLEVPVAAGDSVGLYAMWSNTTGRDLHGVYLQVVLPYAEGEVEREQALPFYVDTNYSVAQTNAFDLPPGRTVRSYEFDLPVGGGLLAAGGHLHDYGVELRLEEVATGRVITRLNPELDAAGRVLAVEQRVYRRFFKLLDARLRLEAGVRYRVVGVYHNPTGDTLRASGMAHIVGLFVPDDMAAWPARDPADPGYRMDVAALPHPIEGSHVHH